MQHALWHLFTDSAVRSLAIGPLRRVATRRSGCPTECAPVPSGRMEKCLVIPELPSCLTGLPRATTGCAGNPIPEVAAQSAITSVHNRVHMRVSSMHC